ncbi:MAG: asparaginase domain-containing protein [Synergistaceae bacterium]|nr:asparaginase domain-containing protein [Synergistaceae bacterium]
MANRDKIALILAGGQIVLKKQASGEPDALPLDEEELIACLPEEMRAKTYVVDWSRQPVNNYTLRMCSDLVQMAGAQVEEGAAGVVLTCGTQALTEAAYFADLVWSYPQPLIFTSSIHLAGTPGSETALLLSQAVRAAEFQACWGQGVLVCLQDRLYAASELCHLSNYSRFGYTALLGGPVAEFSEPAGALIFLRSPRRGRVLSVSAVPARNVELVDVTLGGGDVLLNALLDGRVSELDGLVIAAFGSGDVPPSWVPLLRKMARGGLPVALTSRCPMGRVQPGGDFEGGAKGLLEMGLVSGGTLTPLQARVRLAVGLGAELRDQALKNYMLGE